MSKQIRFKYVATVAPDDQRLFRGSIYDPAAKRYEERWFLADHSGDGRFGHIGRPDQTEDGPLAVVESEPIRVAQNTRSLVMHGSVRVEKLNEDRERYWVGVTLKGALYLADTLGMELRIEGRRAIVLPETTAPFYCVEGHPSCMRHSPRTEQTSTVRKPAQKTG